MVWFRNCETGRMEGPAAVYRPRAPEQSILYTVVAGELETFLARQQERDRPVPGFVEDEFRSILECGILEYGIPQGQCGAVTFIQRFGSALNLTPHFHAIVFDGVYAAEDGEAPRFYPLRPPETRDVLAVAARVAERAALLMETEDCDGEGECDSPPLGALYSASIAGRIATGPNAGRRVRTLGQIIPAEDSGEDDRFQPGTSRCAMVSGFSVHAGVGIRAEDRKGFGTFVEVRLASSRARRTPGRARGRPFELPAENAVEEWNDPCGLRVAGTDGKIGRISSCTPVESDKVPWGAGSGGEVACIHRTGATRHPVGLRLRTW